MLEHRHAVATLCAIASFSFCAPVRKIKVSAAASAVSSSLAQWQLLLHRRLIDNVSERLVEPSPAGVLSGWAPLTPKDLTTYLIMTTSIQSLSPLVLQKAVEASHYLPGDPACLRYIDPILSAVVRNAVFHPRAGLS